MALTQPGMYEPLRSLYGAVFGDPLPESIRLDEEGLILASAVDRVLSTLTPREEKVLKMRFGFVSSGPQSLKSVGEHYSVSPKRIRQIEVKALRKLRHPSRNVLLREARNAATNPTQADQLSLSGLRLKTVPEFILKFSNISALDISRNLLTQLPNFIREFEKLEVFEADTNEITKIPPWLFNMEQLRWLDLSNNLISALPYAIGNMLNLHVLALDRNQLAQLPEEIGDLINLEHLSVGGNLLRRLPESIRKLRQLRYFSVQDNQLGELPDSIRDLTILEELYLHNNPDLRLPDEILGPVADRRIFNENDSPTPPSQILEYYFRVRGGSRPLNEAKLILVGRGGVGKTSIVRRLVEDRFEGVAKTEGINITDLEFTTKPDEQVRLNIWDFGGQEIMHATHQFFLTQRSLYLLVVNGREGQEDQDAEYWLKLIDSFGADSPIIVVMNKIKEHAFDLNRRGLTQKYPNIRGFVKTDCRDDTGISELRDTIKRETDLLEHLRDPFPAAWFKIKNHLSKMRKNFLNFGDYRNCCARFGEKDAYAQDVLAGYLHSLGIALNYREDPRLQDTHVLNPRWVTTGIYKLLNSRTLEAQQGEFRVENLRTILDNSKYPAEMHHFLIDLMKKFELCFGFPEDDGRYLIPELLDKEEPVATAEFVPQDCLNFQYNYPVLPAGLLPRFIVRSHSLIKQNLRWRSGVVLHFEGCSALVKSDSQDKSIRISITGPITNRRRLLAVIRSDFERIHRDIRSLDPEEMVPIPRFPNVLIPYRELLVMEKEGVERIQRVVNDAVISQSVSVLLNGVDLDGWIRGAMRGRKPIRVFYSYSHKDEKLGNELETHLKLMQRQGLIEIWHDRKITPGDKIDKEISEHLERADFILLLISADFLASDYCYEKEMKRALERHANGDARVISIILHPVNWKSAPFADTLVLPTDGKPVTQWRPKAKAWKNISEEIERLVENLPLRVDTSTAPTLSRS